MGFKIGRSTDAPILQTKKTARYGEQKVVATETPVATEREEVVEEVAQDEATAPEVNGYKADMVAVDEYPAETVVSAENVEKPVKAKRGRKPKKA